MSRDWASVRVVARRELCLCLRRLRGEGSGEGKVVTDSGVPRRTTGWSESLLPSLPLPCDSLGSHEGVGSGPGPVRDVDDCCGTCPGRAAGRCVFPVSTEGVRFRRTSDDQGGPSVPPGPLSCVRNGCWRSCLCVPTARPLLSRVPDTPSCVAPSREGRSRVDTPLRHPPDSVPGRTETAQSTWEPCDPSLGYCPPGIVL